VERMLTRLLTESLIQVGRRREVSDGRWVEFVRPRQCLRSITLQRATPTYEIKKQELDNCDGDGDGDGDDQPDPPFSPAIDRTRSSRVAESRLCARQQPLAGGPSSRESYLFSCQSNSHRCCDAVCCCSSI